MTANETIASGVILEEIKQIREEISSTKKCQVQFVIVSLTAVSILMGYFAVSYANKTDYPMKMYLIPLAILFPIWTIFTYKSISISRMRGYSMVLEDLFHGNNRRKLNLLGWENALDCYQEQFPVNVLDYIREIFGKKPSIMLQSYGIITKSEDRNIIRWIKITLLLLIPFNPNKYRNIVNSVFFWISLSCLILYIGTINSLFNIFNYFMILIFIFFALMNSRTTYSLTEGYLSPFMNKKKWEVVLKDPYERVVWELSNHPGSDLRKRIKIHDLDQILEKLEKDGRIRRQKLETGEEIITRKDG